VAEKFVLYENYVEIALENLEEKIRITCTEQLDTNEMVEML